MRHVGSAGWMRLRLGESDSKRGSSVVTKLGPSKISVYLPKGPGGFAEFFF